MKFLKQAPVTALLIAFLAPPAAAESDRERINRIMAEHSAAEADRDRQVLARRRRAATPEEVWAAFARERSWRVQEDRNPMDLFTFAFSNPEEIRSPHILFGCDLKREPKKKLYLSFSFEDLDYSRIRRSKRSKKGWVHLQLGFWAWVRSADGPDVLRQETIDYDWPNRIWDHAHYLKGHVRIYHHGAADIARRIYSSESISWTDRRTEETNSLEVGEKGRKAIEQIMGLCGLAINESP